MNIVGDRPKCNARFNLLIVCCVCACIEECWSPLGVQSLPDSSFSASSHQWGHPPRAGRLYARDPHKDLQGWSPDTEQYRNLPTGAPEGHSGAVQAPYLQLDLLRPHNITGNEPLKPNQTKTNQIRGSYCLQPKYMEDSMRGCVHAQVSFIWVLVNS